MEKIASKLRAAAESFRDDEPTSASILPPPAEEMREAAILWSKVCLQEFRDDLLRKGLNLSASIADFLAEFESSLLAKS